MDREGIQSILTKHPHLREKLFAKGFLLTDAEFDEASYPFYSLWQSKKIGEYCVYTAKEMTCYQATVGETAGVLIGHAYNPFTMEYQEEVILNSLIAQYGEGQFWDSINELTGVFCLIIVHENEIVAVGDPSGMLTVFYSTDKAGHIYIASHTNLIGDLLKLEWDPYVKELSRYRFFKLLGNSLPGNFTQFKEVNRLIPNHALIKTNRGMTLKRFYFPSRLEKNNEQIASEAAYILHANLVLIAKKWERPAISMTGGCDSKTTLACAEGLYDNYSYFSYISSEAEEVDALAAKSICKAIGQKHKIYKIPATSDLIDDYDASWDIINWNSGDICPSNPNEIRKRIFLSQISDFNVEVKSWASEIGRAYYSKRFHGRMDFGKLTPRKCTTLYKFFLHNRKLVRQTDIVFEQYLNNYFERAKENPIEWQEQFFWEFRVPSWNGMVITGEHRYSFEITIPYNNRRLLELLLSAPIEDRINDTVYEMIRTNMNPIIDQTGIAVTNLKHTKNREKAENAYYSLHSCVRL